MASGLRKKGKDTRSELEIMTEERDEAKANWDKAISERNQALDFEIHCCKGCIIVDLSLHSINIVCHSVQFSVKFFVNF